MKLVCVFVAVVSVWSSRLGPSGVERNVDCRNKQVNWKSYDLAINIVLIDFSPNKLHFCCSCYGDQGLSPTSFHILTFPKTGVNSDGIAIVNKVKEDKLLEVMLKPNSSRRVEFACETNIIKNEIDCAFKRWPFQLHSRTRR